jgi:hypothetical protein
MLEDILNIGQLMQVCLTDSYNANRKKLTRWHAERALRL